ncbi:hypothetical protein [Vitiosangium sp. GDMCC 1.1324]|uniref:hypothetical protein n=1 Tax=Vitiosangium sp. (strain GDMCC 1.1324) TaxID=2138576 RepID=UPI000D33A537|nr:hypothetical protein [Vitiosangium sp. GDMCC 1.1324]PTL85523.1 hypothetical protein DAT35_02035 [Vitiosangium sp. GDMCC 1.1324]
MAWSVSKILKKFLLAQPVHGGKTSADGPSESRPTITKITVAQKGQAAKVIDEPEAIGAFSEIWNQKEEQPELDKVIWDPVAKKMVWTHDLKIEMNGASSLWLYNSSGVATRLTKNKTPIYAIKDPESLIRIMKGEIGGAKAKGILMTESGADALFKSVNDIAQEKWIEAVRPKHQSPDSLVWQTALSDPFPSTWPLTDDSLVFYAYARGANLRSLTSGELIGPVWARITVSCSGGKPNLVLLDTDINPHGRQGVRPLTQEELEILRARPTSLLLQERSIETDRQIRAYYCLQSSLGNVPKEVMALHGAFFEWLGCSSR